MSLLAGLWRAERRQLTAELDGASAVTLSAAEAENAVAILDEVIASGEPRPVMRVDVGRTGGARQTALAIAYQAAVALADGEDLLAVGSPHRTAEQTARLLEVRRALGEAFGALDGSDVDDPTIVSAALDAFARHSLRAGQRGLLVLIGAERALVDKNLAKLLWSIRGAAQRLSGLTLVFCGGPGVSELTSDPKAAFYGWGTEIALGTPDTKSLTGEIELRLRRVQTADDAARSAQLISDRAGGSVSVAEQLADVFTLRILSRDAIEVSGAWTELLAQHAPRLRVLAATTAELHKLALPVAIAIAHDQSPYQTTGGYNSTIARTITTLRAAGVIDRRGQRQWRIVDPLFAAWLQAQ